MMYNKHNIAVAKIASRSETRPEISGVFFTKDKTVATDSFRLVEISVPTGINPEWAEKAMRGVKPFIVSADMLKDKIKLGNEDVVAIKHVYDNRVEFLAGEDVLPIKRIEGKYPDYMPLFPQGEPQATIKINAKYLSEVLDIVGKLGGVNNEVEIKIYNKERPMITVEAKLLNQKGRAVIIGMI